MGTHTVLTNYLSCIESDTFGEWIIDRESNGTLENPIQMPYVAHSDIVQSFIGDVYDFVDAHPEYELNHYHDILEANNIRWEEKSMQKADISSLNAQCVVALLVGAIRADRFCEGVLLSFFKNGMIQKCLIRLKALDEA